MQGEVTTAAAFPEKVWRDEVEWMLESLFYGLLWLSKALCR